MTVGYWMFVTFFRNLEVLGPHPLDAEPDQMQSNLLPLFMVFEFKTQGSKS